MSPRPLPALAAGSVVGALVWLSDLASASTLSFAGVSDAAARQEVLRLSQASLLAFEARLLVLHLVVGGAFGWLAGRALESRAGERRAARRALEAAGAVALLYFCAVHAFVARYPQLVADRWWLAGGFWAGWQRFVTHTLGPLPFEALAGALILAAALVVVWPAARALSRSRTAVTVAGAALVLAGLAAVRPGAAREASGQPLDVLVLAVDSLRGDRLEDPEVMPFLASRIREGSLFRYAVTPVARTYPSWVSALTGLEPRGHGVRHMFPTAAARREMAPTFYTALRDRGYATFVTSDFAGDVFQGFEAGFEVRDVPHTTLANLARSSALAAQTASSALLRTSLGRTLLPEWKGIPALAEPEWVVDAALRLVSATDRPLAGLVFFSTAHFPYAAPWPYYRNGSGDYAGPYLYHVPPVPADAPSEADVAQIRARYDAALTAIDAAIARLFAGLRARGRLENTIVVVTGDHGEDLYEDERAGHGDTVESALSQAVPILLLGPGVPAGTSSDAQVRLYDLPATLLELTNPGAPASPGFGDGRSLFGPPTPRPVCVETGVWFWPTRPPFLQGRRLTYPGIAELLEMDADSGELVLKSELEPIVETAKERGLVLGSRAWLERMTPSGIERRLVSYAGIEDDGADADLATLYEERCVNADPALRRVMGGVVFAPPRGEAVR